MSVVFLHDSSWPGFLCAVAEFLNALPAPTRVAGPGFQASLADETVPVFTDGERARRLLARLAARQPPTERSRVLRAIEAAFSSDTPGADHAAACMIAKLFKKGPAALDEIGTEEGALFERAVKRLEREAHLFLGHTRFVELADGSWFARIRPDCAVLPFIGEHFAARFADMVWAIRDEGRGSGLTHRPGEGWQYWPVFDDPVQAASGQRLPVSANEEALQAAWTKYHRMIAIRERRNPRLQKSFLPSKFHHEGEPLDSLPPPVHRERNDVAY